MQILTFDKKQKEDRILATFCEYISFSNIVVDNLLLYDDLPKVCKRILKACEILIKEQDIGDKLDIILREVRLIMAKDYLEDSNELILTIINSKSKIFNFEFIFC